MNPEEKDREDILIILDQQVAKRNVFVDEADIRRVFLSAYDILTKDLGKQPLSMSERNHALSQLADFCIGEFEYRNEYFGEKEAGDSELSLLSSRAARKLLASRRGEESSSGEDLFSYYDPLVATLVATDNYFESINHPLSRINPDVTLMNDLFETTFKQIDSVMKMISMGLYRDAFSAWRNIHESECIVKILVDNGDQVRFAYKKHLAYNNFYRNKEEFSKEELDEAFLMIKEEMKEHDLKSKDMKKFIEYGWLYSCPAFDVRKDNTLKLNFRDGLERIAGLKYYEKDQGEEGEKLTTIYEFSSEIAHSSYLFFYSNDDVFKELSLDCVYRSSIVIFETYLSYMDNFLSRQKEEKENCLSLLQDTKDIYATLEARRQQKEKEEE